MAGPAVDRLGRPGWGVRTVPGWGTYLICSEHVARSAWLCPRWTLAVLYDSSG